ncbi:hypothetical protein CBL_08544 [Carabus blaptoides fortunei]
MTCSRQEASRIQCAIDALRKGGPYTSKIKRILSLLRAQHYTLNLSTLTLLKQRAVDKIRALSLARKKLVNRVRWLKEHSIFLSYPSRLFRQKPAVSQPSLAVDDTENIWRALYEQEIPVQNTPALALFENFCNSHLTDPPECPSITAEELKKALSRAWNFAAPGVDGIINFWWKSFPVVHERLAQIITAFIRGEQPIPSWLAEGRTVLIPKSGDLSFPKNYRPITCLNTLYTIFTSMLNDRVLSSSAPPRNSSQETSRT